MNSRKAGNHHESTRSGADPLEEFCAPGTTFFERMMETEKGVSLRVVSFYPESQSRQYPFVLAPGLVSVMMTFKNILIELTKSFIVHYVETREKSSSNVTKRSDYQVSSIGMDLIEIVSQLYLKDKEYILCGTSLSATAMVDRYSENKIDPFCIVLLEPNAVFIYPKWSLSIIRFSAPFYRFIKPVVKWYLKNFVVNTKEDYEMFEINRRALDAADPYKLRDVVLDISKYQIWDRLASVKSPTLIVYASKDTFHRHDDITKMVKMIKNSTPCDLETHERIHSREFVDQIKNYLESINHEK